MSNRLQTASARLAARLKAFASVAVTYRRGEASVPLQATIGRSEFEEDDGAGATVRVESRDYLVDLADLGELGLPQVGDVIDEGSYSYEVCPQADQPCWQWSGPGHDRLRIHTKQTENQA